MPWLDSDAANLLLETEREAFHFLLPPLHGYYLLQMSGLDVRFVEKTQLRFDFYCGQQGIASQAQVDYCHLPFRDNTIDCVVMHHVLDFTENPHQSLREAARVLLPNGYLVVVGFNPWSMMGVWRRIRQSRQRPWRGNHISPGRLHDWLTLLGFRSEREWHGLFVQPLISRKTMGVHRILDKSMRWIGLPFGGVYIMVARKLVAGMTPIRPKWRPFPLKGIPVVTPSTRGVRVTHR